MALLATEFRRLSNEQAATMKDGDRTASTIHDYRTRDELVDLAFEELEKKNLDEMSIMQLRHEMQSSLKDQIIEIFQAYEKVDNLLPAFDDGDESSDNGGDQPTDPSVALAWETILNEELDHVTNEMKNPTNHAPKGLDPKLFLEMKQGALETLLDRRRKQRNSRNQSIGNGEDSMIPSTPDEVAEVKPTGSWVEADNFGYHESIDEDTNNQIRHHQTINLCRSALLRQELGYSVVALKSTIPGAGRGVFVDGFAKAGSILAFQPGLVWPKEYMLTMSYEEERELQNNDNYQMSLRHDDHLIDSRKSPYTVLTGKNSNPMALGHVVNHPTPTMPLNCQSIMVNFLRDMNLNADYIPNTYARPPTLTVAGGLWDREAVDMHGMCLIATRDVCNEEIFYDYRLMTSHLPRWYNPVEDRIFVEDGKQEKSGDDKEK